MTSHAAAVPSVSYLQWMISSLGPVNLAALLVIGVLSMLLSALLLTRGRGPFSDSTLVLIVLSPLLLGIFLAVQGAISSFQVIAMSSASPKPADVAEGVSASLFSLQMGILCMLPGLLIGICGGLLKAMSSRRIEH